jgi:tetratricopeptide (TPR) repeat protein
VNKNKYLFGLIGLAAGFLISFFAIKSINESEPVSPPAASTSAPHPGATGGSDSQSQQGMMANVSGTLEKAKNNPNDFTAQVDAARVHYQINQFAEAIEYLKKAHELQPDNVNVTATIGNLYFEEKKYVDAEKWYTVALKSKPDETELYVELASTFLKREPPDADRAIQEIQKALKQDPKNAHAMAHLIEAHLLKKDARSAEETLNKLKEAEPNNQRVSIYQGLIADLKAGRSINIPKEE